MVFHDAQAKSEKVSKEGNKQKLTNAALDAYRKYCLAKIEQENAGEALKGLRFWHSSMAKLKARLSLIKSNESVEKIEEDLHALETKLRGE